MNQHPEAYLPIIGRILLGGYFLLDGLMTLGGYGTAVSSATAAGVPDAGAAVIAAIIVEIGLGLAVILGYRTHITGLLLAVWVILLTVLFHANTADPAQMQLLLKNLAIVGGLLYVGAYGKP